MTLFDAEQFRGKRVCVALSGGVDSVCLLHAFKEQAAANGIALSALHVEHGIRGEESVRDMEFCKTLCAEWGVPLAVRRFDVPSLTKEGGGSMETVARGVRYAAFREVLEEGADLVATAHHADDVAETVLFRLARGTGLSGMRAIEEYDGIVRPLLSRTRAEIEAYAAAHGLPHVEDSTNGEDAYTRNYIRHTVLPAFRKIHKKAAEHLVQFAARAAKEDEALQSLARAAVVRIGGEDRVPVDLPDALFERACLLCLRREAPSAEYTHANLRELSALRQTQGGRKIALPGGGAQPRYAFREGGDIVFACLEEKETSETPFARVAARYLVPVPFAVRETERKELPAAGGEGARLLVDLDAFPEGCVVRTRREGDEISPCNAPRKTLKKFLNDRKISARLSRKLPVIAKGNEVYVVVGVEIADSVKVTETSARCALIY